MIQIEPANYIIARKRKKYRFALFANSPRCFEFDEWSRDTHVNVLEIGAGTGLFSVNLAASAPSKQVVAVDVKADRLQKGAGLADERGLTNLRFLRCRADQLLEVIQPHSLEIIWITFPDPFPRTRSEKHRLTHPQYLTIYHQLLTPDGSACFKTDAPDLFQWSLERFVTAGWRIVEISFDLHNSDLPTPYKTPTTYETRFMSEGLPIYFVRALPPRG